MSTTSLRQRRLLSCLALMPLAALLSACPGPINVSMTALDCPRLIPPALREPTPSATGPESDSQAAWVGFGVRQTGQLDKSNVDREAILQITDECHRQQTQAREEAQRRNRPWYRRIL